MDWQKRTPIVSLLLVVAIAAVPFVMGNDAEVASEAFESVQAEAREYIAENPRLEVDRLGERTLGAAWLSDLRETQALSGNDTEIRLPARMLARSQARLDGLIDAANAERMQAEPAWRLGVLDRRSPPANLFAHAFVHENIVGGILAISILLLAGIALERVWGSVFFGLFAFATIPAIAQVYLALDASSGIPWSGSAGLVAAVLGAYCIRGLGGAFSIPGWVVVPVWLGLEVFLVRGLSVDQLGSMPWATVFSAFGLGALVAGAIKLANFELRFAEKGQEQKDETNPILTRASRLSSDGDPYQAFDLLQAAWRDNPTDAQVAEAFYSTAVEIDQPEAAAEAILPIVRTCLRKGQVDAAVEHWFPLATRHCDVQIEATAAVRLGEALLDSGHPEEALFSLKLALENGASAAHATRIVNVARDLDADLARRAAQVALADPSLDPMIQQGLEAIAFVGGDGSGAEDELPASAAHAHAHAPAVEPTPESRSQLDRRVSAEHHAVDTTAFPLGEDLELSLPDEGAAVLPERVAETVVDQHVPHSQADFSGDLFSTSTSASEDFSSEDSGDVLSHWNDPGALDAADLEGDLTQLSDALSDEALFEEGGLDAARGGEDFSDLDSSIDSPDLTASDQTPVIDATDEMTSPMIRAMHEVDESAAGAGDDDVLEQKTQIFETPPMDNAAVASLLSAPASDAGVFEFRPSEPDAVAGADLGAGVEDATTVMSLRELRVIDAIPVEATARAIEIDADGRGKSKLPIDRIQAVAVAAVSGIVSRPVLIIDFVLNWSDDIGSPMKSIRFRSDRFDPLKFAPGEKDALSALMAWVGDLQAASRASALPSRDALEGEFARFDSLEEYERVVLMAKRSDDV